MTRVPVESSAIAEVGYDESTHTLEVLFKPGRNGVSAVWTYKNVSPEAHAALMSSPSIGRAFAEIRRLHSGRPFEPISSEANSG